MVSTSTLPPRRAAAVTADAAATDVLPTPPEPQNTTTSRAASKASNVGALDIDSGIDGSGIGSADLVAERLGDHARDAQAVVAHEQIGHEDQVEVDLVAEPREMRRAAPAQRHCEARRVEHR